MKQKSIAVQIAECQAQIDADVKRWDELMRNGCSDPFYPDGVNLNLVRNHIIYGIKRLAELDQSERQMSMFDVGGLVGDAALKDKRIPPKVDDNFMVKDKFENGRRIKVG